jgi:hypothetical protein
MPSLFVRALDLYQSKELIAKLHLLMCLCSPIVSQSYITKQTLREVSVGYWTRTSERKELLSIVQTTVGLPMTGSQRGTEA